MKQKKKQRKTPKKLPDFSLEDIVNAPKPKVPSKRIDGLGCNKCGRLEIGIMLFCVECGTEVSDN